MKKAKVLCVVMLVAVLHGCGPEGEAPDEHPQRAEVEAALSEMLAHSVDPFLIVEDARTESFIQFYNQGGEILVDLPEGALTSAEIRAAERYFGPRGIALEETADVDPETGQVVLSRSWTALYAPERSREVATLAVGALSEVYGIGRDTPLTLTKGWE